MGCESTAHMLMRTTHGWTSLPAILASVISDVSTAMKKPSHMTSRTVRWNDARSVNRRNIAGRNRARSEALRPNRDQPWG
mmetsp:Transcript_5424/g.7897  ORF Transcript_5424/g.7897 Transcript_5424/m.7897 type:complete len:80 (+) Transcript_5424:815-1054(+)